MSKLFDSDLDEIIQKIFLYLDPMSLKNCNLVCEEWNQYIHERLWNSQPARKILYNKLIHQWKYGEPLKTEYTYPREYGVNYLAADDEIIVCGHSMGTAWVFDIHTSDLKFELLCNKTPRRSYDGVYADVGKSLIATTTDHCVVSVWSKEDGSKFYQATHHHWLAAVRTVKVYNSLVISGAGDGSLVIVENMLGVWKVSSTFLDDRKDHISHIDIDDKWAVVGSNRGIKLWDLDKRSHVSSVEPVCVWRLAFKYPTVFVVGGLEWKGIQIWNVVEDTFTRVIDSGVKAYNNIHLKNRFLTVCECNETWDQDDRVDPLSVVIFDVNQLTDSSFQSNSLWRRHWDYYLIDGSVAYYSEQMNAVTNSTALIVSHGVLVTMNDFWKVGVKKSRTFESKIDEDSREDMAYVASYFSDSEDEIIWGWESHSLDDSNSDS